MLNKKHIVGMTAIATFALSPGCRSRPSASGLSDGGAPGNSFTCSPNPKDLFLDPSNIVPAGARITGVFTHDTFAKAKQFLEAANEPVSAKSFEGSIFAEAFGSGPGTDPQTREWLIIYHNAKLHLVNQIKKTNLTVAPIDLKRLDLAADSQFVTAVTGANGEQFLTIRLAGLAEHRKNVSTDYSHAAITKKFRRFLEIRNQAAIASKERSFAPDPQELMDRISTQWSGPYYTVPEITGAHFKLLNDNGAATTPQFSWLPRTADWSWSSNPTEQPIMFEMAGDYYYAKPDGPQNDTPNPIFRRRGNVSEKLIELFDGSSFGTGLRRITAVAPDWIQRSVASAPAHRYQPRAIDHYAIARYGCYLKQGREPQRCVRAVDLIVKGEITNVFGEVWEAHSDHHKTAIKALAFKNGAQPMLALAADQDIYLLEKSPFDRFVVTRRFRWNEDVTSLSFYQSKDNKDKLLLAVGEGTQQRYHTLNLDLVNGPILLGRHQPGKKEDRHWAVAQHVSAVSKVTASSRQASLRAMDGTAAVHAVRFIKDADDLAQTEAGELSSLGHGSCQYAVSGGSDGQIMIWDLKGIEGAQSGTPNIAQATLKEHSGRISAIATASWGEKQKVQFASAGTDGKITVWNRFDVEAVKVATFPAQATQPADESTPPAPSSYTALDYSAQGDALLAWDNHAKKFEAFPLPPSTAKEQSTINPDRLTNSAIQWGDDFRLQYQPPSPRALELMLSDSNPNGKPTQPKDLEITSLAAFPSANTRYMGEMIKKMGIDQSPPDPGHWLVSALTSAAFSSKSGGLYSFSFGPAQEPFILMQEGRTSDIGNANILNMHLSHQGQWAYAARDDGLTVRVLNSALVRHGSGNDFKTESFQMDCNGASNGAQVNLDHITIPSGKFSMTRGYYRGHEPNTAVSDVRVVAMHYQSPRLDKMRALISAGYDGKLIKFYAYDQCEYLQQMRERLDNGKASPPTSNAKDNKLIFTRQAAAPLTALDTSPDSEWALTGSMDGAVMLWWIGDFIDLN